MKRMMVRYKVKAERADENERYIVGVFAQLKREQPAGLRYAAFRLEDGVSFVHIVSQEGAEGGNPLAALAAFKAFIAGIRDRCEEPPVAMAMNEVGAYRLFEA